MSLKLEKSRSKAPFYLNYSYAYKNERTRISTGVKIENIRNFNEFDSNNPIKKSDKDHKRKNQLVNVTYNKIHKVIRDFELNDLEPYPELVKNKLSVNRLTPKNKKLSELIDDYLSKKQLADSTKRNFIHLKKNLIDYNPTLRINDLNNLFWDDFSNYLFQKKLANNTVNLRLTKLKTVLDQLSSWGYEHSITSFKKPKEEINNFYLDMNEIQKIRNYTPTSESEKKTKEALLIQCYTAYRIGDLKKISYQNVTKKDGTYIIKMSAQKNMKNTYIPLHKSAANLLKKNNWSVPKILEQKYNKNIKKLLKNAGVDRMLQIKRNRQLIAKPIYEVFSSHDCVKTGISYYLNNGFSPAEVAGMTGKNVDTIMKYYYPNASQSDILLKHKKIFG